MSKLFYRTFSEEWMEGLPIGNGRLAAMVWGEKCDRLTLNHEWLWTGRNRGREVQQAAEGLPLVREYIRQGYISEPRRWQTVCSEGRAEFPVCREELTATSLPGNCV